MPANLGKGRRNGILAHVQSRQTVRHTVVRVDNEEKVYIARSGSKAFERRFQRLAHSGVRERPQVSSDANSDACRLVLLLWMGSVYGRCICRCVYTLFTITSHNNNGVGTGARAKLCPIPVSSLASSPSTRGHMWIASSATAKGLEICLGVKTLVKMRPACFCHR